MLAHAHAPMLTAEDVGFYASIRAGGNPEAAFDPRFSPLQAHSFAGLPPTVAISAECDPLAEDARLYCDAITAAGGHAKHVRADGLVHGYLRARHSVDCAKASFDQITALIAQLGRGDVNDVF